MKKLHEDLLKSKNKAIEDEINKLHQKFKEEREKILNNNYNNINIAALDRDISNQKQIIEKSIRDEIEKNYLRLKNEKEIYIKNEVEKMQEKNYIDNLNKIKQAKLENENNLKKIIETETKKLEDSKKQLKKLKMQ